MARDAEMRAIYDIAFALKKSIQDILNMPAEEVAGWSAYLSQRQGSI